MYGRDIRATVFVSPKQRSGSQAGAHGDNWRGTVLKDGGSRYLSQFVSRSIDNWPRIPLFTGMPVEALLTAHLRARTHSSKIGLCGHIARLERQSVAWYSMAVVR